MRIFSPLRDKRIALLFSGQLFSNIGDELYAVSLAWFSVELIGFGAGYVYALQAGSILLVSLFGGIWSDHWDHRRTLIGSDIIRCLAVLILPVYGLFYPMTLEALVPVSILVAALSGFFQPALHALIPELVTDRSLLHATNGLMESPSRIARIIGPGIIAALGRMIPLIHFFTLDAISFFISAISVWRLGGKKVGTSRLPSLDNLENQKTSWKESLLMAAWEVNSHPSLRLVFLSGLLVNATWILVMPLGMALLVQEKFPTDVRAFALLVSAYGLGNVAGNLWVGSITLSRPELFVGFGRALAGMSFFAMVFAPDLSWMMLTAVTASLAGPVTDVAIILMIQRKFHGIGLLRVSRLNLAANSAMTLIVFALSPRLLEWGGVSAVVLCSGLLIALGGGLVLARQSTHFSSLPS